MYSMSKCRMMCFVECRKKFSVQAHIFYLSSIYEDKVCRRDSILISHIALKKWRMQERWWGEYQLLRSFFDKNDSSNAILRRGAMVRTLPKIAEVTEVCQFPIWHIKWTYKN